jgi:succinate dehydrogenase/fumarate reductase flavoprotein subunit
VNPDDYMREKEEETDTAEVIIDTEIVIVGAGGAGMTAALTDWVQQIPGWKVGLLTLLASSVSAGIAAVMNLSCIAEPPEDDPE